MGDPGVSSFFVCICMQPIVCFQPCSQPDLVTHWNMLLHSGPSQVACVTEHKSQEALCEQFLFLHHLHGLAPVSTQSQVCSTHSSGMTLGSLPFQSQGLCTDCFLFVKRFTQLFSMECCFQICYKMLWKENNYTIKEDTFFPLKKYVKNDRKLY